MRTHGLNVNTHAIAKGIFDMIPDDDRTCMVFGMLPLAWMDMAERLIREQLAMTQYRNLEGDELELFAKAVKPKIVSDIMQQLAADMLGIATEHGICKV